MNLCVLIPIKPSSPEHYEDVSSRFDCSSTVYGLNDDDQTGQLVMKDKHIVTVAEVIRFRYALYGTKWRCTPLSN